MKRIFAIYCLLLSSITYGQEVLTHMNFNPRLYYPAVRSGRVIAATDRHRPKSLIQDSILLEETDTLTLPFIDEFSTNTLKPYDFGSYIYGSILNAFGPCDDYMHVRTVLDTFSLTPTYTKSFDTTHQVVDSVMNAPIKFYYYPGVSGSVDGNCFNHVGDSAIFYPKGYVYTFDSVYGRILTQTIDTPTLDTIISYAPILYRSRLPLGINWVDNYAYHNYTTAFLPPTIGVVTLDGLNEYGQPYDPNSSADGIADYLTSKPIDLSTVAPGDTTSVYLSFYYQRGGFGDAPTLGDSLVVQFLNSYTNQWDWAWSVTGDSVIPETPDSFQQVFIKVHGNVVPTTGYFFNGFQFRFLNYGSLAGNNDIWNIDYVRLDKNREDTSATHADISDISFQYRFPSILKNYEEMPAWQYKDSSDLIDTLNIPVSNLNITQANANPPATTRTIVANELYPAPVSLYTSTGVFNASAENVTTLLPSTEYVGIVPGPDSMVIRSMAALDVNNILKVNDTISSDQVLTNVLAYDDGTAEAAYGIQNLDLKKFGYEFILNQPDTIVGFQVMFGHIDENVSDLVFQYNLWDSIRLNDVFFNDSAYTVWTSFNYVPRYDIDTVNGFTTYRIDPLPVGKKFYFGWAQTDERNIQIGYDLNSTKGRSHMYVYTSGVWHASTIGTPGSPMIRLLMRHSNQKPSGITDVKMQSVKVYPNPTFGMLNFDLPDAAGSYHVELYNTLGQLCHSSTLTGDNKQIDISHLNQGMYMLRLTDSNTGVTYQNKIEKE